MASKSFIVAKPISYLFVMSTGNYFSLLIGFSS